jgi:hypothetical protein
MITSMIWQSDVDLVINRLAADKHNLKDRSPPEKDHPPKASGSATQTLSMTRASMLHSSILSTAKRATSG